jgi:hypothetical protein
MDISNIIGKEVNKMRKPPPYILGLDWEKKEEFKQKGVQSSWRWSASGDSIKDPGERTTYTYEQGIVHSKFAGTSFDAELLAGFIYDDDGGYFYGSWSVPEFKKEWAELQRKLT